MWETGSLNWPQLMLQWFIWVLEFTEFTEFLFNLRKLHCGGQWLRCILRYEEVSLSETLKIRSTFQWILWSYLATDGPRWSLRKRPCSRGGKWLGFYVNKQWSLRNHPQSTVRRQVRSVRLSSRTSFSLELYLGLVSIYLHPLVWLVI